MSVSPPLLNNNIFQSQFSSPFGGSNVDNILDRIIQKISINVFGNRNNFMQVAPLFIIPAAFAGVVFTAGKAIEFTAEALFNVRIQDNPSQQETMYTTLAFVTFIGALYLGGAL